MTALTRDGHVIPGSGFRGGFSSPSVVFTPSLHSGCHTHYGYHGRTSLLGSGIILTICGVALTALGIFAFAMGDIPDGIGCTVVGGLSTLAGVACLIACFARQKFD